MHLNILKIMLCYGQNDLVMIFGKLNKRKTFIEQVITFDHKRLFGIILKCNDI